MNQLKIGTRMEMEHKDTFNFVKKYFRKHERMPTNKMIAKRIAGDHLKEDKQYYKKIKKVRL